ncbi:phosphotransferase family protein [Halorussus halophilus]|uniref:phosphotransferase family protein n=1 Tax=Halorussus halophilus TaxID=2650975 RepID=UPI0013011D57|nr:phosphotransferase [Halorussus halophilus]
MDDRIASVLEAAFPEREVEEVGETGPSWNEKNRTVRVDFEDETSIYLKIATDGDGSRVARETATISYVGENSDVPVPTILASEVEGAIPYLATAPVDGKNLLEVGSGWTATPAVARQVGRALAELHSLRFEQHGHVFGGDEKGLELDTGTWTEILLDKLEDKRELAPANHFEHHFDEVREAVEANRELLDEAPATLLHGDPARPNCFQETVSKDAGRADPRVGFLDWEIAHVGDPVRELRRTRSYLAEPLDAETYEDVADAFRDGYRERAGGLPDGYDDRLPVYDAVVFLSKSTYLDNWKEYADASTAELKAWLRTEMRRRLDKIS